LNAAASAKLITMQISQQETRQFLHDLRTPLSVIKLMLEVIKNAKKFESQSLEILEEESLKL
jgi:signal transduction histidine kinase